MDYEKLIDAICNEVNKRIYQMENIASNKKTAIVLWDDEKSNYSSISHLFNTNFFEDRKQGYDVIIVARLCLRGLSTLALGTNVSEEERFILTSLLRGKKVYVIEDGMEYRRYKNTAPKPLYNKYLEYEKQIKTYGVKIISNVSQILDDFSPSNLEYNQGNNSDRGISLRKEEQEQQGQFIDKKLISEADLNKLYLQGIKNVSVEKTSIITPLADDYLRSHKMIITKI